MNGNALKVLEKRYLKKDAGGNVVETPEEMFRRVAINVALGDKCYDPGTDCDATAREFYEMMSSLEFLPNSPTLMNAGRELQQLSACFVLPVEDDLMGIYETLKNAAFVHQSGGGTGFSFSRLRPAGDIVKSTMGVASGPISFMKVYDASTEQVKQGGTRRGANMGILRVDHPDIMEFVSCKDMEGAISNFNLSVAVTDGFMEALKNDSTYQLVNPRTGKAVGEIRAKDVFERVVEQAWKNGEPGVVFIDRINEHNPTPHTGKIEATNPCGEQPLLPYESCNLGSINLSLMTKDGAVDWSRLGDTVKKAVHFLDNVIDMNRYPIPQIEKITKLNRKIGIGVMGWADMLLELRIRYNSMEAVKLAEKVMSFIHEKAVSASSDLANSRGNFPNYKGSTWERRGIKVRNATLTTIAPTGSISIIAGCSSGIEPVFAWRGESEQVDETFTWEHPLFAEVKDLPFLPEWFVTASQVAVGWHIKHQAAFQKNTDNAVSKTVNMPIEASKEDVEEAFLSAYSLGCKGITVYRDGSRVKQVIRKAASESPAHGDGVLPDIIDEKRVKVDTKEGRYYIHVSHLDGEPKEVFVTVPPQGASRPWVECIARLISQSLRHGVPYDEVLEQLYKSYLQYGDITSPLLAVNKGLQKALESLGREVRFKSLSCPDCGGELVMEEGCTKCYSCGFSKC
ncbi:MAG: ribonucleoside-diphosphate reductase, adenosylcobalamin-dependent [Deltaproteobacteria bacterium GWB2_55_19]|nr:MAG: ribonucleoside-diphosphate reductase, adenosylcobalamin-dependent [Deltaproteobacteria bacterium GWB2_55_19]